MLMTIEELKKNQEEAKANGANCLPYPECVEQVQNTKDEAGTANSNTSNQTTGTKTISIQETKKENQYVEGIDNNLLIIGGIIVFVIIILLLGILIALNKIAKKKN